MGARMNDKPFVEIVPTEDVVRRDLARLDENRFGRYARFVLAALSSLPWVGGLIGATGNLYGEHDQEKVNSLQRKWLEEHGERLRDVADAIDEVTSRLDQFGDEVKKRIESEEYLSIVRKAFRAWDNADTKEKRRLVQKLLAHAGGSRITSDDVVSLFVEWIERYHEIHFAVIREAFQNPGSTRSEIWAAIHGDQPREDSAEADLFKLLIHDLSTGHVIRQARQTDREGRFIRKATARVRPGMASPVMKSAFDDKDQYVLTELGKQFVHYTMNEIVPRVGTGAAQPARTPPGTPVR
jgi:hypothetical protein